jgi:hypothetical protein
MHGARCTTIARSSSRAGGVVVFRRPYAIRLNTQGLIVSTRIVENTGCRHAHSAGECGCIDGGNPASWVRSLSRSYRIAQGHQVPTRRTRACQTGNPRTRPRASSRSPTTATDRRKPRHHQNPGEIPELDPRLPHWSGPVGVSERCPALRIKRKNGTDNAEDDGSGAFE